MKKILLSIVMPAFNVFKIIEKNIIVVTKWIKNHKILNNASFTNIKYKFFFFSFRFFTIKFPKSI
jgi:hypothetical protein